MTGDFDKASSAARLLSVVAIAASMGVVLLLASATWGLAYPNGLGAPTVALTVRDLPHWFEASLLVLSGVAVAGGIVATILPRRYLFLSALADLAMLAVVAVILVEWNRSRLGTWQTWHWESGTFIAATVMAVFGVALWAGLVWGARRKPCPDCAEHARASAINCPHCGYEFPLPNGQERCQACRRAIRSEARVCRYCRHRVDQPVEHV